MEPLSISGTIALLKEAGTALQAAGKIDLWNKVVALQAQLIDLQLESQRQEDQLKMLKSANLALEDKLRFSGSLTFAGAWYVYEGDPHPYCMNCWEARRVAVHLQDVGNTMAGYRRDCRTCDKQFFDRSQISLKSALGSMKVRRV